MLEQNMAIGEETNGKAFRTALQDLRALLQRQDVTMTPEDRIRLVLLFIITQEGVQPKERKELMELAGIQPGQVAILNLGRLGVNLLKVERRQQEDEGRSLEYAPQAADLRHGPRSNASSSRAQRTRCRPTTTRTSRRRRAPPPPPHAPPPPPTPAAD